jgi:hypothetical protein
MDKVLVKLKELWADPKVKGALIGLGVALAAHFGLPVVA